MAGEDEWARPPEATAATGDARRIGVELEFADLAAPQAAMILARELGGVTEAEGPQRVHVRGGPLGDFTVELDLAMAHAERETDFSRAIRDAVAQASSAVIPTEIVCPPIAWDRAHALDSLCAALRAGGARGTRAHPFYAFGLQLNVEAASVAPAALLRTLRAFILLRDWLRAEIHVDASRKVWFFAAPFGEDYCAHVLDPAYAPDQAALIDDYLAFNPSRDRELDALPLLAHLDEPRVRAALPDEKIKKRPAWHYRLPNCEIDDPRWSPGLEWARWVRVEQLAADADRLERAARAWRATPAGLLGRDWEAGSRALAEALA